MKRYEKVVGIPTDALATSMYLLSLQLLYYIAFLEKKMSNTQKIHFFNN
jgi:hypothetical protein